MVLKQLPIKPKDYDKLATIRQSIYNDKVTDLAEQLINGDITIGAWQESMKAEIRALRSSMAAIGKGGWVNMTQADWGRIGQSSKEQYRYLADFAQYIANNRDSVSLQYIINRAKMYGDNAKYLIGFIQLDTNILNILLSGLGGIPRDGSTECMNRCKCIITLDEISRNESLGIKTIRATWNMQPAEHCPTCISRDKKTIEFDVSISTPIPSSIGNYSVGGV